MRVNHNKFSILLGGQSLIEVIVATTLVVALAVSLVTVSLVTQRTSRSAKNNTQASKLIQQNLEQIRVYRDRKGFSAIPGSGICFTLDTSNSDPSNWSFNTCSGPNATGEPITLENVEFRRKITLASTTANERSITVIVSWVDSGGNQSVSSQTFLTAWCLGVIVPGSPCPTP
ncbi:hypothetical protein A2697_03665 [Candidatus Curtissbacteria bacterium RIFCSPHIGHO2_01_FULL_41_44]|uniref:Type II secretion system protein n=1 Tax=Candidatus Curtissbacteria bacterium RIFCSPLOWO2_01_FULL_42_50 TaxID=1797730 RepID=A0A1F5H7U2_9BACT|nr:MAG: hypothetical protein A2697_03665 [Candidatus Curtissbacteria bacterium RIFCSPHIGHO2_01_FULL_41_44]OGD94264.1 MAG: hypothetical protein A3C33_02825 [Candidatus Curtissbacteria bacterium RIFCSPHIGHO2_02_FULL_42_58]OGD97738.1 MAG: hypothetical protein A3E71_03335 [Candidatus Curtissbacteria bacterium RIFCSPHIGHO2_12_FULL_42_33]OGE00130.1 MAG: hypothetical protein A3B54_01880 [Candidatus Curtissbacteria bacterium RIFCSPLOWO2_01_FULL_42_50]OGE02056.1 MAG: hypothetical protein A3G16_00190 [Ca